jgi:hypothetical protein
MVTIIGILMGDGERQAAVHASAVAQDGAGAALAVVASFLGSRHAQPLAQGIEYVGPGTNGKLACCPVYLQGNLQIHDSPSITQVAQTSTISHP